MFFLVALATAISFASSAHATPTDSQNLCRLLKKEQWPSAYLIDKDGKISAGPINFGRYAYSYASHVLFYIPTTYRIVLTPARVRVREASGGGEISLSETKSVCPNSKTYKVAIAERESNTPNTDWLPLEINELNKFPPMEDPKDAMFTEGSLRIHFDSHVIGEIYDATLDEKK